MAEAARGSASRAELLELKREHEVVEEGHRLLDERRVLLARELLARLNAFDHRRAAFDERERAAHAALADATDAMGLEQLQVYPPLDGNALETERKTGKFIGVSMTRVELAAGPDAEPVRPPVFEHPEARAAAEAFASLYEEALQLASDLAGLYALEAEYRRTQRRVRALEKILLPELEEQQRVLEAALEELEIEEAVRVRLAAKG
ncbi:MAG: V-type ATP synthase subunit D [Candidatus Wenzhouxiangella sp. M2_3B_020]